MTGGQAGTALVARPSSVEPAEEVVLRDGSIVLVRAVGPADGDLLAEGFGRLSQSSRRHRFLMAKTRLTPAELRYFTDVDHTSHEAIGVLDCDGAGVGIGRFVRSTEDPRLAEVALTIVDEWHRRGVGTVLLSRLIVRAREVGIHAFTALVSTDNQAMIGFLRRAEANVELVRVHEDTVEYEISFASG